MTLAETLFSPIFTILELVKNGKFIEYVITNYRAYFAIIFLLPLSVLFETALAVRNKITFWLFSAPHKHQQKIEDIQRQIEAWKKDGAKEKLCTARPGWQAMSIRVGRYKKTHRNINISMQDIVKLDIKKQIVHVEPMVSMGQITALLLPLGWTLPVVPELDELTVGGLIMGFGVESSSHKYGLFQYICEAYEIVLADGTYARCTKDENPELFYAIPWSHGTLGFLVGAEIRIIPAKKYVHITYEPLHTKKAVVERFEQASKDEKNQFVELLQYSDETGVLMTGVMADNYESGKLNEIGKWYKPWFFKHVESHLQIGKRDEYVPLRDYYHRHTRSIFWELQDIIPFGNQFWFRFIFGWMCPPKIALLKLTETKTLKELYEKHHVIQDMLVPVSKLGESLKVFHDELNLYPLWVCPMKVMNQPQEGTFIKPIPNDEMFVDIGAYGTPHAKGYSTKETMRRIEHFVRSVNGFQALYADTYMSREEFKEMFDHTLYNKMRVKYSCDKAFPEVYDKISKAARI